VTKEEVIRRGESAERLLGDETAMLALAEIEKDAIASWLGSNPADVNARESAYRMAQCVKLLKLRLESWRGDALVERRMNSPNGQ
jgi:hypothetical protein